MKTDIVINYDELTKDKEVSILINNIPAFNFQIQLVQFLMSLVNIVSPVKFILIME